MNLRQIKQPHFYMNLKIQQSPFYDMSSKFKNQRTPLNKVIQESYQPLAYLPNPNDYKEQDPKLKYQKYQYIKYDQSLVQLKNKQDDKHLNNMINLYRNGLLLQWDVKNNEQLRKYVKNYENLLLKYYKENQKAYIILLQATRVEWVKGKGLQHEKMLQNASSFNKSRFPLLTLQEAKMAFLNPLIRSKNKEKFLKLFEQCIKYGEKGAFLFYGSSQRQEGNHLKAYQIYKNGSELGSAACFLGLGKLFTLGSTQLPKNPELAVQYYERALRTPQIYMDYQNRQYYQIMKNQLKQNEKRAQSIKTTEDAQAELVADFIANKLMQSQVKIQELSLISSKTNNFTAEESFSFIRKSKIFYVVFSPLMTISSRGFLAEDQNGVIQNIYLYNWVEIPPQKLRLLHRLGTKVILKQYIKKQSSHTKLPMIRVQNANWIEILPGSELHCIKNKKLRQFGATLFGKDLYEKTIPIYTYLISKNAEQLQIVYSNLGLGYQKLKKNDLAIKFYKKSLEIKDYMKSKQRLFYLYLNLSNIQDAESIISSVTQQPVRKQMIEALKKIEKKKEDKLDFNISSFIKKKKIKTNVLFEGYDLQKKDLILSSNPTGRCNFKVFEGIFIRQKFECHFFLKRIKGKKFIEQEFLQAVRQLYELPQCNSLNSVPPFKFNEFFYLWSDVYYIYKKYLFNIEAVELFNVFQTKKHHLEKRLINYCRNLEQNEKYNQALEYYLAGKYMPDIFSLRAIQLLVQTGDLKRAQNHCEFRLQQLTTIQKSYVTQDLQLRYRIQHINILLKLKLLDQVYKLAIEFIELERSIKEQDKRRTGKKGKQSYNEKDKEFYRKINRVRVLYALCFARKNKFGQAMFLIDMALKQKSEDLLQVQVEFQLRLLKARIFKSQQKNEQSLNQVQDCIKTMEKISLKQFENRDIFLKAFKMEKILILMKCQRIQQLVSFCEEIVKLSAKNLIYVQKRLFQFAYNNANLAIDLLQLVKKLPVLSCLSNNLFTKLSAYFVLDSQKKQKSFDQSQIKEKILKYFKIQKQQVKKEENQVQAVQDSSKNEIQQDFEYYKEQYNEKNQDKNLAGSQESSFIFLNQQTSQFDLIQQQQQNQQFQDQKGYICKIKHPRDPSKNIIVIFDPDMRLQVEEKRKFVLAANKVCKANSGSNGIKVMKDETLRLKINGPGRLVGRILKQNEKVFYIFDKRQKHDDYKRK